MKALPAEGTAYGKSWLTEGCREGVTFIVEDGTDWAEVYRAREKSIFSNYNPPKWLKHSNHLPRVVFML